MSSLKTNSIASEDLRAINGPVPQADGRLASIHQDPGSQKWHYSISPVNPKDKAAVDRSEALNSSDQARKSLSEKLPGVEGKAWRNEPYRDLTPGQPWFRQRIGEREVPAEAVFARACHTGNVDLAMASVDRITKPNAQDANGNSLLVFAAGMRESSQPMESLLHKGADPRRAGRDGWTPAHAAAAIGEPDRVLSLARAGANPGIPDKAGHSAMSLLSPVDRKALDSKLPKPSGPKPNPLSQGRAIKGSTSRPRSQSRDIRSF